jgi:hypothetical protein
MSSVKTTKKANDSSEVDLVDGGRVSVPTEYFVYVGDGEAEGNSVYRCLNCPTGPQGPARYCILQCVNI